MGQKQTSWRELCNHVANVEPTRDAQTVEHQPFEVTCRNRGPKRSHWTPRTVLNLTMLQRFVRTADLDKVYSAYSKVLATKNPTGS